MSFYDLISIIISIILVIWAFYLFTKKRKIKEAIFFSIFILLTCLWIIFVLLTNNSKTVYSLIMLTKFDVLWGLLAVIFFLFFVQKFRNKNKKIVKSNKYILFISFFFLFSLFLFPDCYVFSDINFYENSVPSGGLNFLFTICFSFLMLLILTKINYFLFKDFNGLSYLKKTQIKYIAFGGVISISLAIIFDIIFPWIFNNENFYSLGPISFVFFIGFTSYAIIKHQLLDIKLIIQRGIIYSVLFSTIIGIYLVLVFLLGFFFQQFTDIAMMSAALATTIACIYTVPIIERYFRKKTDKIFFKDKYDYSEAVFSLSEILNKNIDLETLLRESAKKLKSILKIKDLRIILPKQNIVLDTGGVLKVKPLGFIKDFIKTIEDDDITYLVHNEITNLLKSVDKKSEKYKALKMAEIYGKKFNISVTVPIKLENKLMGLLALGKKLSGDIYTNEDYSLLKTFSVQAGVALEKSQLYEKVKDYSIDLEKKVKERILEIKTLQEEQKQMMLEISHGLQTPLTIIKGELHTLENQVKNKKNIEYLEKNIDRISRFIYDMLKLARMENQKDKIEKENFNLSELLFDLIESFKIITMKKNISVNSDIEKNIFFNGSKKEIEELVMNIVSNSVKYFGEKKNKEINFILKKKDNLIELSIADTGIGIKKEKIAKLFSRFYRAGDDNRGTGLGLAICKEIVSRHLGEIKVESKEGEGTKLIILLPLINNKNKHRKI